jgi:translocation protein SEC63
MAEMKFEYEFNGEIFLNFIIPFGVFILMMITCCLWPESEEKKTAPHVVDIANVAADHNVHQLLRVNESDRRRQARLTKIGLILTWIVLFIVVYHMSPVANDNEEFNPFVILNVDEEASVSEIKQAYHELSKQHHPDRGGDPEKFKEIAKAYKTLTDEQAKENWRKYGNLDGLRELRLGFAIPKWFADTKNSMFILCTYTSFFLIIPLLCCLC